MSSLLRSWRSDRKDSGFTLRLRGVGWSCGECDLYIDADCADHVDGAKSEGQRCGHGEDGQVLDGKVEAEESRQDEANGEQDEAHEELRVFAHGGDEGAVGGGLPQCER